MGDVAHTLPDPLSFLVNSTFSRFRPGATRAVAPTTGRSIFRDWSGYNLTEVQLVPKGLFTAADKNEFLVWLEQSAMGMDEAWIMEPLSHQHRGMLCGPLGDGTQDTFPLPVYSASDVTVFVDGAPSSDATAYASANLLVEDNATLDSIGDWAAVSNCTVGIEDGFSLDGLQCLKITPSAGGSDAVARETTGGGVSVGVEYTATCWIRSSHTTAHISLNWRTVADADNGTETGGDVSTVTLGGWTQLSVTGTAPASTATAEVVVTIDTPADTEPAWIDCISICPGNYKRWHRPSQAPGVLVFGTAPTAGQRVSANATGRRLVRCVLASEMYTWTGRSPGILFGQNMRMIETPEY